jgi:hypothetical protein
MAVQSQQTSNLATTTLIWLSLSLLLPLLFWLLPQATTATSLRLDCNTGDDSVCFVNSHGDCVLGKLFYFFFGRKDFSLNFFLF